MAKHLERELERLKQDLLTCGALVETAIEKSVTALEGLPAAVLQEVIERDNNVNKLEVEIEEICLKIIALHQPVAEDLRFVASVIRINNDLERIGDYAVSIAKRVKDLVENPVPLPKSLKELSRVARQMFRDSLDAFVRRDTHLARRVFAQDDAADAMHRNIFLEIRERLHKEPQHIDTLLNLLTVSRRLERIADMATNIAQDVVYMVDGEIVRHQ